jgi:hypothetical protein
MTIAVAGSGAQAGVTGEGFHLLVYAADLR